MKIYHFALIFLIFFLGAVIKTDISVGKLKAIENENNEITSALSSATADAVNYLSKTGSYGGNSIKKDEMLTIFYSSLFSSLGIISDYAAQAEMEIYIPVILLCDTDGYYVYYYDEYKAADGNTYVERVWSEKLPYSYEDECFIYRFTLSDMVYVYDKNNLLGIEPVIEGNYKEFQTNPGYADFRSRHGNSMLLHDEDYELVKRGAIINKLEEVMSYYTSKHNYIANKQGITYSFSFPEDKQHEWAEYIDDVNILVVFQGYPYGPDRNFTYNKIASTGANIVKKSRYYVEKKSWYYLAHRQGCEKIKNNDMILDETFDTIEECVRYGAYCCDCIEHGARVPVLK
ncbi:MAG TPA: hypothetical protein GX002_07935 [Clostridiales bacterium]|jgi:hypothetical protein|nr:hypothetical protein [Clostridiales bacterium]